MRMMVLKYVQYIVVIIFMRYSKRVPGLHRDPSYGVDWLEGAL